MKESIGRTVAGAKGAWTAALIVVAVSLLSTLTLSTPNTPSGTDVPLLGPDGAGTIISEKGGSTIRGGGSPRGFSVGGGAPVGGSKGVGPVKIGGKTYDCTKGQNAGATDVGVTANKIQFAATYVTKGVARDFLYDAQFGINAVVEKVRRNPICGRIIDVAFRNDSWERVRGQQIIDGWIGSNKYFGLAVNPSSEGLEGAIASGSIRNARFPVIGADGMLISQYRDPWVWPVATSTSSVMHIMARDAVARGARKLGIVWETNYRFGVEGFHAFKGAAVRAGASKVTQIGIQSNQSSYKNQVNTFIGQCGGSDDLSECDFIAMLLEPNTASDWVRDGGLGNPDKKRPTYGIGAPQPLFLDSFASFCAHRCANMRVWTSFKPPISPFSNESAVARYVNDLSTLGSTTADPNNPHVQGAYVGMLLVVEALERLGPAPTRLGIKQVLDSMRLQTGLGPSLAFAPGNHFAATSAQAFQAIVQPENKRFQAWRYTGSGFIVDKEVGKDIP